MLDPGQAGRLVDDRGEKALGIVLRAALDQAVGRRAPGQPHRPVERGAVQALAVDITNEVLDRPRRVTTAHRAA